jgi:hypothetical protein
MNAQQQQQQNQRRREEEAQQQQQRNREEEAASAWLEYRGYLAAIVERKRRVPVTGAVGGAGAVAGHPHNGGPSGPASSGGAGAPPAVAAPTNCSNNNNNVSTTNNDSTTKNGKRPATRSRSSSTDPPKKKRGAATQPARPAAAAAEGAAAVRAGLPAAVQGGSDAEAPTMLVSPISPDLEGAVLGRHASPGDGPCSPGRQHRPPPGMATGSVTARTEATASASAAAPLWRCDADHPLERVLAPVLASGYLTWYETMAVGATNRGCRSIWVQERDTSPFLWRALLKELNGLARTDRCPSCHNPFPLRHDRTCCSTVKRWTDECSQRSPTLVGCADIVLRSKFLTWNQMAVGMKRVCKATYRIHREECRCYLPPVLETDVPFDRTLLRPFLELDPRFQPGYDDSSGGGDWTDYERCQAMARYLTILKGNLLSHYDLARVTDPERLPDGVVPSHQGYGGSRANLERRVRSRCPQRYAFLMNIASLYDAQRELQWHPPRAYASAFLGGPYVHPDRDVWARRDVYDTVSVHCMPATDAVLVWFLRTHCYPTRETLAVLGPLAGRLCIFSPFFDMVPPDRDQGGRGPVRLPDGLEIVSYRIEWSWRRRYSCSSYSAVLQDA